MPVLLVFQMKLSISKGSYISFLSWTRYMNTWYHSYRYTCFNHSFYRLWERGILLYLSNLFSLLESLTYICILLVVKWACKSQRLNSNYFKQWLTSLAYVVRTSNCITLALVSITTFNPSTSNGGLILRFLSLEAKQPLVTVLLLRLG